MWIFVIEGPSVSYLSRYDLSILEIHQFPQVKAISNEE